ncbi:MAG: hypothetical protein ABR616_18270 [Dermatophilaceae bacterium]
MGTFGAWTAGDPNHPEEHNRLVACDEARADAFGRLRVSNPSTLFEASFTYDTQPLLFQPVTVAGGTIEQTNSALRLSVDGTAGAAAVVQSRQYTPYEKGKSQLVKQTFVLGPPTAGVRTRVGYFDPQDGFFLQQTGDGLAFVRRSSTLGSIVETTVPQADWNLDRFDGTGPSGITLDPTTAQILMIDGQWLGVGRVRLGFNVAGVTYYVHQFVHANTEGPAPYVRSFTLPVRYEIETVDAGGIAELVAVCCEVESEGGIDSPFGLALSTANDSDVSMSTTPVAVLSLRPAAVFPAGGRTNRSFIIPGEISLIADGEACIVEVQYDPTLSGGTWTRANPNSAVEVGTGQTLTSPGIVVGSQFVVPGAGQGNNTVPAAAGDRVTSQYPLTLDIDGANPKALTIVARTLTGTGTIRAAGGWREIR